MDQCSPAFFIADALGLDFLNSIATPVDTPIDWIDGGEGLLNWLEQARLVPADLRITRWPYSALLPAAPPPPASSCTLC